MDNVGIALIAGVMAVGVVGTVVPFLPGLLLMWVAGLAYGLLYGFQTAGVVAFGLMTVLLVSGTVLSAVVPHRAGVKGGAAKSSLRLGIAGAIVGFFVIPVLGLVIGGAAGVMAGEYRRFGDAAAAWRTTRAVVIGFVKGALVEVLAGLAMLAVWIGWVVAAR